MAATRRCSGANGSIYYSPKTGAWHITGGIKAKWSKLGYEWGDLAIRPVMKYMIAWCHKDWWLYYLENGRVRVLSLDANRLHEEEVNSVMVGNRCVWF